MSTVPTVTDWKQEALSKINPQRTALLVIDLQNDFCSEEGALARLGSDVSSCQVVASRVNLFLPKVRQLVGLVAFFRLVYDVSAMSESQKERLIKNGKPVICSPDGVGSELFIVPNPEDLVFVKHRYSPFSNHDFRAILRERSIETVAVTGVDTHICVEGAIRQGYDLGYRMIILSDLVGTRASELNSHEHSLAVCERYFALRLQSSDFLTLLSDRRHVARGSRG